jgi:hypothetical protein
MKFYVSVQETYADWYLDAPTSRDRAVLSECPHMCHNHGVRCCECRGETRWRQCQICRWREEDERP